MNAFEKQHQTPDDVFPTPRRMDFSFSEDIPTYVFKNNPVLSAWGAAMSTVFPDGERFFIDSVRHYENQITDPELRKAIKAFIGQEAHHGREHDILNEWLESKGLPVSAAQVRLKEGLALAQKHLSPKRQLAVTVALEHFTAMLADVYLDSDEIRSAADPRVETLFYWHAIEETEHKAVAYDVYESIGGDYFTRCFTMLSVSIGLIVHILAIQTRYLLAWKQLGNIKGWLGAIKFLWVNPGWLRKTLPSYLRFFKPGFHPWQEDNRNLLQGWQEKIDKFMIEEDKNFEITETLSPKP
jgi:predicted metal-dependent hydrolase